MTRGRKKSSPGRNILHIIDTLDCGGAQRLLVSLAQWTPAHEYRTIVCVLQPGLELKDDIERRGVQVFALNRPRPSLLLPHRFIAYVLKNMRDIHGLCRARNIHVVHCHLSDAELLGIPTAALCGVERILTTVHYPDLLPARRRLDFRSALRRLHSRFVYGKWADYVVAVSRDVASRLKDLFGVPEGKIRLVLNRIDTQAFGNPSEVEPLRPQLGIGPNEPVITNVARLMPPKGQKTLIEAIHRLALTHSHFKVLLVGEGELRKELVALCHGLGLEDRVMFLGSREDIPRILSITDLFVLPSVWEGTSLALLEAMAAGCPIIATAIPGNQAIIKHMDNGCLVPPEDPEALAQALAYLLDHPEVASRLGGKAAATAEDRYDIRLTVEELRRLWD